MNGAYSVAEETKVNITAMSRGGKRPSERLAARSAHRGQSETNTGQIFKESFNLDASLDMDQNPASLWEAGARKCGEPLRVMLRCGEAGGVPQC
jgi:hypothetical protein